MNANKYKPNPKKVAERRAWRQKALWLWLREREIGVSPKYRNGLAKHTLTDQEWETQCKGWNKDNAGVLVA